MRSSQAIALAIHTSGVILIFLVLQHLPGGVNSPPNGPELFPVYVPYFAVHSRHGIDEPHGGGGGGDRSALPVTSGKPPKFSLTQFVPPSIPRNANPILVAETSLVGPPELQIPSSNLDTDGNPLGLTINDSGGPGHGGGMGNGEGTGLGPGHGPGFGPGSHGGFGGGNFRPGFNGVGFPICVYCPEAKYPDEARKAKFQGVVQLQVVVGPDGRPTDIEVVQGPGLGLDEQAIAAVKTWRFRPALGPNRLPVPTQIIIEVQFRLL